MNGNGLIYFDNAATSYPKPASVVRAVNDAILNRGGNPGRGEHPLAAKASELVYDTREKAAKFFGAAPENVVFTQNATLALNLAIKGLCRRGWRILIDNYAHNASYRPALALSGGGRCELLIYDASGSDDETLYNIRKMIIPGRTLVITTHCPNITSKELPVGKIGGMCAENECIFVVDGAQSAGHIPIDVKNAHIDALCVPGHKGLFGIMGSGMLISSPRVRFSTIIEGGAGIRSLDPEMPDELPERLEAGTLSLPAVASLGAGIDYVTGIGIDRISAHIACLSSQFCRGAANIGRVRLHGECGGSVVSFTVDKKTPAEVGEYLSSYGICTRTGYHCAPLAHRTLGTSENGSVRVSFSHFNTREEVAFLVDALSKIK